MTDITPITPAAPSDSPRFWAVIPCAGTGARSGASGPKQYQPVAGKPMVMHTLAAFAGVARITRTMVVVAADDGVMVSPGGSFFVAPCGGSTRAASVLNGLTYLVQQGAEPEDWALVHDAARCLVTPAQINALIDACSHDAVGGLLAHKLADTLKAETDGRVASTLDRSDKWLAQTPQMFRIGAQLFAVLPPAALTWGEAMDENGMSEPCQRGIHIIHNIYNVI